MPSKSKYRQNNVFYSEIQTKVLHLASCERTTQNKESSSWILFQNIGVPKCSVKTIEPG